MRRFFQIFFSILVLLFFSACQSKAVSDESSTSLVSEKVSTSDAGDSSESLGLTSETTVVSSYEASYQLPEGFSYVRDINPNIRVELRYATVNNFTGNVVDGYFAPEKAILLTEVAMALSEVQNYFEVQNFSLLVYDSYRPTRADQCFYHWSQNDDESTKDAYYPNLEKSDLFNLGYIAMNSSHSMGAAVDVTLVDNDSGEVLDMGGSYDLFDTQSHHDYSALTETQLENRMLLKKGMEAYGFTAYNGEWWHYNFFGANSEALYDFDVR